MWIQISALKYAMVHNRIKDNIGEEGHYYDGTVIVKAKDDSLILKFEKRGRFRYYWIWSNCQGHSCAFI